MSLLNTSVKQSETILKKKVPQFQFPFYLFLCTVSPPKKSKFTGTKLIIFTITYRYWGFAFQKKWWLCLSGEQRSSVRTPALSSGSTLHYQLSPRAQPCGKNPVLPAAIVSQLFAQGLHQGASNMTVSSENWSNLAKMGFISADCDHNRWKQRGLYTVNA